MLEQLQQSFLASVRGTGKAVPGVTGNWTVYRRNYIELHLDALTDTFSSVVRLVGSRFFRHLARGFVFAADSTSGDLNDYGAHFPAYLATHALCHSMPYLPDMARLDWAWFEVLRSPGPAGDWLAALLATAPAHWPETTARPAARWLVSAYPVYDIWQLSDREGANVDLDKGGQAVLITRPGTVQVSLLAPAEARFVAHWFTGAGLEGSLEAALAVAPDFDLHTHLYRLARLQAVYSLESTS